MMTLNNIKINIPKEPEINKVDCNKILNDHFETLKECFRKLWRI